MVAFSYTVTGPLTSGTVIDNKENIDGNLRLVHGTWVGGTSATATLPTGLSHILFFGVTTTDIQNEAPKVKPNVIGAGTAGEG